MIEKSYIELFNQNRGILERESSQLLDSCRDEALRCFERWGLPRKDQELYLHTPVSEWFEPDWGVNLKRLAAECDSSQLFRCSVPGLKTSLHFMNHDLYASNLPGQDALPEGVIAGGLKELSRQQPELLRNYYNRLANMQRSGVAALNSMLVQDGFLLYVPKGVEVETPVQLVTLMQAQAPLMLTQRVLVILEEGAKAGLLLCDHARNQNSYLTNRVVEVFVGKGAELDCYDMEETSENNFRTSELFVEQQEESRVGIRTFTLYNGRSRNDYFVKLAGRGARLELDGVVVADGNRHADHTLFVEHNAPGCTSNELFKYVLNENATAQFTGRVLVCAGAEKTVAEQVNRNIQLAKSARIWTRPQLEIYADDVKCSHGATVGQLDEKALFYMRQRGISGEEARTMLMLSFVGEVIQRVRLAPLRDRLTHLVERRFRFGAAKCEGCNICR